MKKLLSLILALSLICSMLTVKVSAANESKTYSAADISVTALNNDVRGVAGVKLSQYAGTTYSKGRVYKEEGILGLSSGEYGIQLVGREERADAPYLSFDFGNIDASTPFYYSMNVYIGEQRDTDRVYLGANMKDLSDNNIKTYKDGTLNPSGENFVGYKFFYGDGKIKFRTDGNTVTRYQNGSFSPNNWVNYTIAGDGTNLTLYIDGVQFVGGYVEGISNGNLTCPFKGTIKALSPIVRLETSEAVTGTPSFAVVKDVKLVAGTYTPSKSQTVITSDTYTLPTATAKVGTGSSVTSAITGVSVGTTASTFLSHITAPANGSVSVIKLDPATNATIAVGGSETMTGDMKLLAKSEDGSMKLYDIELSDTPTITSSLTRYSIDNANKIITMPNTTVEKLKSIVTGTSGTTVKVVNAAGAEVTTGTVRDTMKLVASKNSVDYEYTFSIADPAKAFDVSNALDSYSEDQLLLKSHRQNSVWNTAVIDTRVTAATHAFLPGFVGDTANTGARAFFQLFNTSNFTDYYYVHKATIPGTDISAYKFSYDSGVAYFGHRAGEMCETTHKSQGDKTVINFKLYIPSSGGTFTITPLQSFDDGQTPPYKSRDVQEVKNGDWAGVTTASTGENGGDRVDFRSNGKIALGGLIRERSGWGPSELTRDGKTYGIEVGTYNTDTLYDVTIVKSRGFWNDNGTQKSSVITEGIYLNGTNILSTPKEFKINENSYEWVAIRAIEFYTSGTCYMSGLNVYMTDNFDPTTPAAASLAISSASLEVNASDSTLNNMPSIRGYSGTAAALKAAITKDANAELQVIDRTGTSIVPDSSNVEDGMFLKVVDANDPTSYATYIISNTMKLGNFAKSTDGSTVTATRTVQSYRDEGISLWLIAAKYDESDNLLQFSIDPKAINSANTYNFSTDITSGGSKIKFFLWDNLLNPYCDEALASDL